MTMVDIFE